MGNAKRMSEFEQGQGELSIQDLSELYDGTLEELRYCAKIIPNQDVGNEDVELREAALLDFESNLQQQAATIRLRTKEDVLGLMDIWAKIANVQKDGVASPSDRIAMNIFRHMNGDLFVKE